MSNIAKLILALTDEYHIKVWRPFIKTPTGRIIERLSRIFLRILYVFEIVSPPKGEAPCLTYMFVRYPNRWHSRPVKDRIRYLFSFTRKTIKSYKTAQRRLI